MDTIRNDISLKAMNHGRQFEADEIRQHFFSRGCKLKLYAFIDRWYDKQFRKFKKDTDDDLWQRFVETRMNKLNDLEDMNKNRVRIFFEKPEERKNINKSTRRILENMMLLDCDIKKCGVCKDYTVLKYSLYYGTVYAKCLKCGKKYKNI